MDLWWSTDWWRPDVAAHRTRREIHASTMQQGSEHLPPADLCPGHVMAWRARAGERVLRGVRGQVLLHHLECSDLRNTYPSRRCSRALRQNLPRGKNPYGRSCQTAHAGAHEGPGQSSPLSRETSGLGVSPAGPHRPAGLGLAPLASQRRWREGGDLHRFQDPDTA